MANGNGGAQMAMQNSQLRATLLAISPRMRKNLGIFNMSAGQSTRVKLFNVGLGTTLKAWITVPVTIGTAVATPSRKAPYNVLTRIRVTDYDSTDRINISGWQLFVLTCIRNRMPWGYNVGGPIYDANGSTELSGIITHPLVPTAVATASIQYYIEIPLAYDPESDLRGAMLMQTAVGEAYLTVDMNSTYYANGNDDAIYNGAATTTVVSGGQATIQVWQEYLLPQSVGNQVPLPGIDLMTVYELNGMVRSTDNIAAGSEKLINYPNVRSVIGAYFSFVSNSILSNNIQQQRLIANGNNILMDYGFSNGTLFVNDKIVEQRNFTGGDVARGQLWFTHRSKPIETALYGNVQAGITPQAVAGTPYIEQTFESFYTKGSQLPGMQQASG